MERNPKEYEKKLVKMGKQNNYFLCLHPDELTTRMLVIPIIRMLIKTIDCLDKKENNPTPSEPHHTVEEEKKEPQYKPKQKKKKKKKLLDLNSSPCIKYF